MIPYEIDELRFHCIKINLTLFLIKETASVVLWVGFLATDSEVPDFIPGTAKFSEKYWVWNGVHSAS
jgi:hypothetical protein